MAKKETGKKEMAGGAAISAYGVAHAPILRAGYKDQSKMGSASPKRQPGRYQAELHRAMNAGDVATDSPVRVLRTPSGRHINAGGTHRHIARQAMGKPSEYEIKDLSHEIHTSPAAKLKGKLKVAQLSRGSKRAEAGKKVRPVGRLSRKINGVLAAASDVGDDHVWNNASGLEHGVKVARRAGTGKAALTVGAGGLVAHAGYKKYEASKKPVRKSDDLSAFGVSKSKPMSEAELHRRQKLQSKIGRTTSTLGLGGLGMLGVAAATKKNPGALKRVPGLKRANPEKFRQAALNTGVVSSGIGGVGGFNQASIYSAESRRKKVQKNDELELDVPYMGDEGDASRAYPEDDRLDA